MRKSGTLNAQLARVLSETGHTDTIVITDAGLPIPHTVERVDLAFAPGKPNFLDVLDVVLAEMVVEGAVVSEDLAVHSPELLETLRERFDALGVRIETKPHPEFKRSTTEARAAVRSGEFTWHANVILIAGVAY